MVLRFLAFAFLVCTSPNSWAATAPEHSKVAISQKKDGDLLSIAFKVEPHQGLKVTLDAPWKLVIESQDLSLAKTTLSKADLDANLPGFVVKTATKPKASQGKLQYTLTSFVCTEEKTQCYREVHTGFHSWNHPTP